MDSLFGLIIAIYARYSTAHQRDASIEEQIAACRKFIEARGGIVVDDLIFADRAESGSSADREDFDRLYKGICAKPRLVDAVAVWDTKRLSRDLGDADRFYKAAAFAGVRLFCVSEGIDSAMPGAKAMFAMQAMQGEWTLDDLSKATLRALEGQARRDRSTGGLPLGYGSTPIMVPGRREPIGFDIVVDPPAAALVKRIFELYAAGRSPAAIATQLNSEGLVPPRQRRDRRPGWVDTTIREMLRNESYVGVWRYMQKQWRKLPGTKLRRYRSRPPSDIVTRDRPTLRIIPQELWEEVQERRAAVGAKHTGLAKDGRSGRRAVYPFSGLLFCGLCKAPMIILGGSSAHYYRCADATKRGTCSNRLGVREDVVVAAAVQELRRVLGHPNLLADARHLVEQRLAKRKEEAGTEGVKLERQLAKLKLEVERFARFVAETDPSASPGAYEAIRASLEKTTRERDGLARRLQGMKATSVASSRLPTADEILAGVMDIEARLRTDPLAAREALRRLLRDGRIDMQPQPDGSYRCCSIVTPIGLAGSKKPQDPGGSGASSAGSDKSVSNIGCAGRI